MMTKAILSSVNTVPQSPPINHQGRADAEPKLTPQVLIQAPPPATLKLEFKSRGHGTGPVAHGVIGHII
jgi:hypothetical protein